MGVESARAIHGWPREGCVIAVDSTFGAGSIAIAEGGVVVAARAAHGDGKGQLPSLAREVLASRGLGASAVDAVVVAVGPGRFTGVRSAVAVAKGLAWALRVPVVPVGSLDALGARSEFFVVVGDGPRAAYAAGVAIGEARGLSVDELRELVRVFPRARVVGAALGPLREVLREACELSEVDLDAAVHLRAALAFGVATGPHEVEPAYVRDPSVTAPKVAPPLLPFRDR
jgi:tRNA threonylcarbamoyladenosine biosynthesis protein TsaB